MDSYIHNPLNYEHLYKIMCGDIFYTTEVDNNVKVGEQYKNYPAIVCRIDYKPKQWYQFWKKKEIAGACILWTADE